MQRNLRILFGSMATAGLLAAMASPASATSMAFDDAMANVLFDFVQIEGSLGEGSQAPEPFVVGETAGGIRTATINAFNTGGILAGSPFPYLDGPAFGSMPGGLGVCQTDTTSCGSDDNITGTGPTEAIRIAVDGGPILPNLVFRNGVHDEAFAAGEAFFDLFVDGGFEGTFALSVVFDAAANSVSTGNTFDIIFAGITSDDNCDDIELCEFYISGFGGEPGANGQDVPEPMTLGLLGLGLAGLGLVRRRRKAA